MTVVMPIQLNPTHDKWPQGLTERLQSCTPRFLYAIGPLALLTGPKTALFCSTRAPGATILKALDTARRLRDSGVTVISGFHSPIEKQCLSILLRGKQPIIICPARAIKAMCIPATCLPAFDTGRILFLSPFTKEPKRITKESAFRRNEFVAALADEAFIAHITPGGQIAQIATKLKQWQVPFL